MELVNCGMAQPAEQEELLNIFKALPENKRPRAMAKIRQVLKEIGESEEQESRPSIFRRAGTVSKEERLEAFRRMAGSYTGPPIDDSRAALYPDADERGP